MQTHNELIRTVFYPIPVISQIVKFLDVVNRSQRYLNPDASTESYFGENARNKAPAGTTLFSLCEIPKHRHGVVRISNCIYAAIHCHDSHVS
jgi:hypothetical protein